ncbi:hypothetical protein IANJMKHF_00456 [Klebsiella phage CPRSA]|nr:hypothetical protein IANJMKHF_00456 [Klebsiella phage CPRSA]
MKIIVKVKDVEKILREVDRIGREGLDYLEGFNSIDINLLFANCAALSTQTKKLGYTVLTTGPTYTWGNISQDIEFTFEEYAVIIDTLKMGRNIRENKNMLEGF